MIVVSNAGPLIALAKVGSLDILSRLYSTIIVPPGVYDETVTKGISIRAPEAWAIRRSLTSPVFQLLPGPILLSDDVAASPLGRGEQQVIQVVLDQNADLALLDDQLAREVARRMHVAVKGTVGILAEAFRHGILSIDGLSEIFDDLAARDDIWIGMELMQQVLGQLRSGRG